MPVSRRTVRVIKRKTDADSEPLYEEENDVRKRRGDSGSRRGCFGSVLYVVGIVRLAITVLILVIVILVAYQLVGFVRDPLDNVLEFVGFDRNSTPVVVDSRTIVLGIQDMAVLQTTSGDLEITKTVVDTGPSPDAEIVVSYIGHVTAGIDLSQITEDDIVAQDDGSLAVRLPPAQLTGCYLGKPAVMSRTCTDIPFVQDCASIVARMQDTAYDRALEELRQTAEELNLVDRADREAQARIYGLLKNLGYSKVEFQQPDGESPTPSPSCYPN